MKRRTFLVSLTAGILIQQMGLLRALSPSLNWQALANGQDKKSHLEQWMDSWMENAQIQKGVRGALHLQRFKDPIYILTQPISWSPDAGEGNFPTVNVPVGFVTDFASIPPIFWQILRPDGEYTYPAIIHDYLYWNQHTSRGTADKIFQLAMKDFDVNPVKITSIYKAVQLAGWKAWNQNARLKVAGERRILKTFPQNPTLSWENWKNMPGVFTQ